MLLALPRDRANLKLSNAYEKVGPAHFLQDHYRFQRFGPTDSVAMAGPRKRNRISGQFAARLIKLIESPPYRVLSLSALRHQP